MFVETNDEAAGPDEHQGREEDRDEDSGAGEGHREFESRNIKFEKI